MTSHSRKTAIFFIIIALVAVSAIALYRHFNSSTNELSKTGENKNLATNECPKTTIRPVEEKSTGPQPVQSKVVPSRNLIGTWSKVRTQQEGGPYPGNENWHLTVTFKENGHFVWDSMRYEDGQNPLDESLQGTYLIERGFLITYKFDEPAPAAQKRLPELFAFWPNKQLGQQTFKFRDDFLILGHDGAKLWMHFKRNADIEQSASANTDKSYYWTFMLETSK